jgi:hypothetical protein
VIRFKTTVVLGGKTATGLPVPPEVVEELGAGKRPKVHVTVGPHTYRSSITPMSGEFFIPLSAENRAAAGVQAGDAVEVRVELDTEPRVVEVPDDVAAALAKDKKAKAAYDKLSYSHQLQHVLAVTGAKKAETRARRIAKMLEILRAGDT